MNFEGTQWEGLTSSSESPLSPGLMVWKISVVPSLKEEDALGRVPLPSQQRPIWIQPLLKQGPDGLQDRLQPDVCRVVGPALQQHGIRVLFLVWLCPLKQEQPTTISNKIMIFIF